MSRGLVVALIIVVLKPLIGAATLLAQRQPTPCAGSPAADTAVYPSEALDDLPRVRKAPVTNFSVIPQLGTRLTVRVALVVDQSGRVDTASVRLVDSTGTAFDQDARR
jgi:hypothetical protein